MELHIHALENKIRSNNPRLGNELVLQIIKNLKEELSLFLKYDSVRFERKFDKQGKEQNIYFSRNLSTLLSLGIIERNDTKKEIIYAISSDFKLSI